MKKLLLFLFFTLISSPAHAADLSVCIGNTFFTQDMKSIINTGIVPTLPTTLVHEIGNVGGSAPQAWTSEFDVKIVPDPADSQKALLQIIIPKIKYSARYGDNRLFAGPRVGVKVYVKITTGLTFNGNQTQVILKNPDVQSKVEVDLGGTLGWAVAKLLTFISQAFHLNGKMSEKLKETLQSVIVFPSTYFKSKISSPDGKQIPLTLRMTAVDITSNKTCFAADMIE